MSPPSQVSSLLSNQSPHLLQPSTRPGTLSIITKGKKLPADGRCTISTFLRSLSVVKNHNWT
ncbi:hypothetical protein I79_025042 [Cricetulus griseus]|uniref:Uncharacterized protein n=1 Tax=Cricetulus griseus TaxID=10029 RepID=G3IMA5_CRIGR|nr:hypothetical protein I79_025042 [Cricetulus griseus]